MSKVEVVCKYARQLYYSKSTFSVTGSVYKILTMKKSLECDSTPLKWLCRGFRYDIYTLVDACKYLKKTRIDSRTLACNIRHIMCTYMQPHIIHKIGLTEVEYCRHCLATNNKRMKNEYDHILSECPLASFIWSLSRNYIG